MLIREYRVILPLTVEEYQVAQLYSVGEFSKNETGGGEGVEIVSNEPFENKPLFNGKYTNGQYTQKVYHMSSKVPQYMRILAPKGSLEAVEYSWNAYPYCKTTITNPEYMKEKFTLSIETLHVPGDGEIENALELSPEKLSIREVITIDIANDPVRSSDYKSDEDPTKFKSEKTGKGPLVGENWWKKTDYPVMTCYKVVSVEFLWFGLQARMEKCILSMEHRLFTNFHRKLFCWMDRWHGMTMEEIRILEVATKKELDRARREGGVCGMISAE